MSEGNLSFEQMNVQANQGFRPETDLTNQQFTQKEVEDANQVEHSRQRREKMIAEEFENQYLEPFNNHKFDIFAARWISNAINRYDLTPETHPDLMKNIQKTLSDNAEFFWRERINGLSEQLQRRPDTSRMYILHTIDDLLTFHHVGVDISAYATDVLDLIRPLTHKMAPTLVLADQRVFQLSRLARQAAA